jgi:hypothetical protein
MLSYLIHRPYESICHGDLPISERWRELGLGHLLPMQLTGAAFPVHRVGDSAFSIGRVDGVAWHKVTDDFSIGIHGTHFHPQTIQRPMLIPGSETKDRRGLPWIVPSANPQSPYLTIPRELSWGLDGPQLVPDQAYRKVMDLCVETFDAVSQMDAIPQLWAAEKCLQILQLNYRIGLPELAYLESIGQPVIDREFAASVVLWFIDYQLLEEIVKKKQPAE